MGLHRPAGLILALLSWRSTSEFWGPQLPLHGSRQLLPSRLAPHPSRAPECPQPDLLTGVAECLRGFPGCCPGQVFNCKGRSSHPAPRPRDWGRPSP